MKAVKATKNTTILMETQHISHKLIHSIIVPETTSKTIEDPYKINQVNMSYQITKYAIRK